ncbi:MAG: UDP-N-acetylmuramate dehydrogenase [Patescibacteria group bacterium]
MTLADKFRERFGVQFKEHEPLGKHLNIRIGGPAKWFVEARSMQDLVDAVNMAQDFAVEYVLLGGGSNTLVSDEGFSGLIIKAANRAMRVEGNHVFAEAGVISSAAARASAEAGLRGFEWAVSLPGTIGGAVRGNAGCFGGEMRDSIESVRVLRKGTILELSNDDLHFAYRHSVLKEIGNDDVVLDVVLKLEVGDRDTALAQIEKNLAGRKATQPLGASSAGCMFKNFEWTDHAQIAQLQQAYDIPQEFIDRKRIPAGWIIEKLGLKGTAVGDAEVSLQHGNFLLNKGHATAEDILRLVTRVKKHVAAEVGVNLEEEVMHVGF